jgi:molecular chaperone Hsp33
VVASGGYIAQPLVGVEDWVVAKLEENINNAPPVSDMVNVGYDAEKILATVLEGLDVEVAERKDVRFSCACSRDRAERTLIALGIKDLKEMIAEGETIEMLCHFCNDVYLFTVDELRELVDRIIERSGLRKVE